MSEYIIKGETLTGIADAIRGKTGGTDPVAVSDMAAQIDGIQAGGGGDDVLDALIDRSITEISSSSVTSIGSYAFYSCIELTTVDFPAATSIGSYAFQYCRSLTTVDFPAATSIGSYAFQYCNSLTTANFPVATSIGGSAFRSCSELTTTNFPVATSIETAAFQSCIGLTTVDFPVATSIGTSAFRSCSELKSLLLRNNKVCTLSNTNAFNSTPIASGTGYIYVPSALIEQYKAATNWSTYTDQFRALEDYTVDGTVTGELDPSKTGT